MEDESKALWAFVKGGDFASSELVMTEVPRALKREPGADPTFDLGISLGQAGVVLSMTTVRSVDSLILFRAAAFDEPNLGSLDAIHVVTALALMDRLPGRVKGSPHVFLLRLRQPRLPDRRAARGI